MFSESNFLIEIFKEIIREEENEKVVNNSAEHSMFAEKKHFRSRNMLLEKSKSC